MTYKKINDSDSDSVSDGDGDSQYTLGELQQVARAHNTFHTPIPLSQQTCKADLMALLLKRGALVSNDDDDDEEEDEDARGVRLIDQLADMTAERAVERVLGLQKNTLSFQR